MGHRLWDKVYSFGYVGLAGCMQNGGYWPRAQCWAPKYKRRIGNDSPIATKTLLSLLSGNGKKLHSLQCVIMCHISDVSSIFLRDIRNLDGRRARKWHLRTNLENIHARLIVKFQALSQAITNTSTLVGGTINLPHAPPTES